MKQGHPYLGPDAEVRVGDELGPLALVLRLQVAVQHAHGHAGQGHDEGQRPPQPGSPGLVGRRRRQAASRHRAQGGAQQPRALPQRRHLLCDPARCKKAEKL